MTADVSYSVPMLHVADVDRSVTFYELLGFTATSIMRRDDGTAFWAWLACHGADQQTRSAENSTAALMLTKADRSVDSAVQGAVLYLYSKNLPKLRERLLAAGVAVSEMIPRFYMKKGEVGLADPDGYCIFVGQV